MKDSKKKVIAIKYVSLGILISVVIIGGILFLNSRRNTNLLNEDGGSENSGGLLDNIFSSSPKCGNGILEEGETIENCCLDAGCSTGETCENNLCVELKPEIVATFYQNYENSPSVTFLKATGENIGTLTLENSGNDEAKNTKITISSPGGYFADKIINVGIVSNMYENVPVDLNFLDSILDITSEQTISLLVKLEYYNSANKKYESSESFELGVLGRNYFSWAYPKMVSSWVTPSQPTIREFASKSTGGLATFSSSLEQLMAARWIFENMRAYGVQYTTDVHVSGDYVQFPIETLRNKGGDCEDHAILFASLLESVGIESFIVLVPHHAYAGYINKEGEIIPIETTAGNFDSALSSGAYGFENEENKEMIYPSKNWYLYPQVILSEEASLNMPDINKEITDLCNCQFSLFGNWWTSKSEVSFTNSGDAPGAGCAAMTTYSGGQRIGENLECWLVNPGQTRIEEYEIDVSLEDILEGCSCVIH